MHSTPGTFGPFPTFTSCSRQTGRAVVTLQEQYLFKAAELSEVAENIDNAALKHGFEQLAKSYLDMAEQAERNRRLSMNKIISGS